jgi:hypothetical protein
MKTRGGRQTGPRPDAADAETVARPAGLSVGSSHRSRSRPDGNQPRQRAKNRPKMAIFPSGGAQKIRLIKNIGSNFILALEI